jgi:GNAT superfamily N-acetyltransferase
MTPHLAASSAWVDAAALTGRFYAAPSGVHVGAGWFASLSLQPTTELNVCGLGPDASDRSGVELVQRLGPELPALVFTSQSAADAARQPLIDAGFGIAEVLEPVMWCDVRPDPIDSAFRTTHCDTDEQFDVALDLTAAAHQVPREFLAASIGATARRGAASVWLALLDDLPVSTVWLARSAACIGVMEMMTPPQFQGRGAGRALLSHALHSEWDDGVTHAVLLGTPAGRRLYERLGFVAVDESITCFRGLADAVLDAIGQPTAST